MGIYVRIVIKNILAFFHNGDNFANIKSSPNFHAMKTRFTIPRIAAIIAVIVGAFSFSALASDPDDGDSDSGEIVIDKDNGSINPHRPINRIPPAHGRIITASYMAPMLMFHGIYTDSECAEITIRTLDGSNVLAGTFPISSLYEGINIGYLENFSVTISLLDGTTYHGTYSH